MSDEETFYELLSVAPDASRETIERAYREQVKGHHPDVSDDPNARARFKRLTRAKEVLTDAQERQRYDRLGHEAYLSREGGGPTDRADPDGPDPPTPGASDRTATRSDGTNSGATRTDASEHTAHDDSRTRSGAQSEDDATHTSRPTSHDAGTPGQFALREAVAAVILTLLAASSVLVAIAVGRPRVSVGVLLATWALVAAIAGRFAVASAATLPDDVVRAHAFPLLLLVAAWYIGLQTPYRLLAGGLVAYALFAALYRTVALVSRGSVVRATGLWFVATAPAAVVVYARRADLGGVVRRATATLSSHVPLPAGAVVVAVAVVAVVPLGHALWRLGRTLVPW
ncbi:DnaJ domain-containing protein [Halorarius litoreus]|uniref:DnaJ domain-containing protein n=1 Tax=Halorarius litoreus TaxID=2962676 RepID=UPI0020CF5F95|nr:DnaJ domain-containing protein [Halorarius litoreus]